MSSHLFLQANSEYILHEKYDNRIIGGIQSLEEILPSILGNYRKENMRILSDKKCLRYLMEMILEGFEVYFGEIFLNFIGCKKTLFYSNSSFNKEFY